MKSFGIIAHAGKDSALSVARLADIFLRERSVDVRLQHRVAKYIGDHERGVSDDEVAQADIVLVLGGDGTILASSRLCAKYSTPMLPVHLGHFGFLTETAPDEISKALTEILEERYTINTRMMIAGEAVHDDSTQDHSEFVALNDIVVANGPLSRLLHLRMLVDGKYVNTYSADGLIISSSTGSTAYSLSAGGPLVHPNIHALLVTPICPHSLTARALILPAESEIVIIVERDHGDIVRVTIDGQLGFPLKDGDRICVRRSQYSARLLSVGGADFYDKLQSKLRWGEGPIN